MGNSKNVVAVRCVKCRMKTKKYPSMATLESKVLKQGWKKHPDGRFSCSSCKG